MIGSDRPLVNVKAFRLINKEVRSMLQKTNDLLQVGTFNLYTIYNAF